jgi:hypothetical protein
MMGSPEDEVGRFEAEGPQRRVTIRQLAVGGKVLDPIWATKTKTASRLRGRIETVLDWASVRGFRSRPPEWWKLGRLARPSRARLAAAIESAKLHLCFIRGKARDLVASCIKE